jgi:hypothetical protein
MLQALNQSPIGLMIEPFAFQPQLIVRMSYIKTTVSHGLLLDAAILALNK